jgi:hypothetical protein
MAPRYAVTVFVLMALGTSLLLVPAHGRAEVPILPANTATDCTMGSCPLTISQRANGEDLTYPLDTRFTVILSDSSEPRKELRCTPVGILQPLATGAPEIYPRYTAQFRAIARGTCVLKSGDFSVTITVSRFS